VRRYEKLEKLAEEYEQQGYEVLGIEESYPGILEGEVPQHEVEGQVGLLLSSPNNARDLKVVEVSYRESLDVENLLTAYSSNVDKAVQNACYFEKLGYRVDTEAYIEPCGELKTLKEIWENTTGAFLWGELVEAVSEPGRLGSMKETGKIICEGVTVTQSEIYSIDEEFEPVIDLFNMGVV